MSNFIFAIPLNLGLATWTVIFISSIGFMVMFCISSVMGDYQGLVSTTLKNDTQSRANRNKGTK